MLMQVARRTKMSMRRTLKFISVVQPSLGSMISLPPKKRAIVMTLEKSEGVTSLMAGESLGNSMSSHQFLVA